MRQNSSIFQKGFMVEKSLDIKRVALLSVVSGCYGDVRASHALHGADAEDVEAGLHGVSRPLTQQQTTHVHLHHFPCNHKTS